MTKPTAEEQPHDAPKLSYIFQNALKQAKLENPHRVNFYAEQAANEERRGNAAAMRAYNAKLRQRAGQKAPTAEERTLRRAQKMQEKLDKTIEWLNKVTARISELTQKRGQDAEADFVIDGALEKLRLQQYTLKVELGDLERQMHRQGFDRLLSGDSGETEEIMIGSVAPQKPAPKSE